MSHKQKHVGPTSSRVSPPLGHLPDFEIKPLRPRSGGSSSPIRGANERKRKGSRLSKDEALERREPVNCFYRAPVVPLSLLHGQVQPLCTIGQNSESLPL